MLRIFFVVFKSRLLNNPQLSDGRAWLPEEAANITLRRKKGVIVQVRI
jgi:hypothetical protein